MNDEYFMSFALKEAKKGDVFTHPNPLVGAVIVKNNKIISKGYHKEYGKEHAEVNAINKLSKKQLEGSTLYVTLEPCSTYGKTPPCSDLIIKSKIKRVVIGSIDPNPVHNGKGIKILKDNGIDVKVGVLKEKTDGINKPFFVNMIEKRPYITVKLASSIDSKIATSDYKAKWISCENSRIYTHKLRAESDCILVGINTVLKDNPLLNIRNYKFRNHPDVCIIDLNLKTPENASLFKINRKVFIVTIKKHKKNYPKNVVFIKPEIKNGVVDIKKLIKQLYRYRTRHILVEGGGKTIGSFISQMVFDRIVHFIAPIIIGKDGINGFDCIINKKNDKLGIRIIRKELKVIGDDIVAIYEKES